jgi:hypothetical protein
VVISNLRAKKRSSLPLIKASVESFSVMMPGPLICKRSYKNKNDDDDDDDDDDGGGDDGDNKSRERTEAIYIYGNRKWPNQRQQQTYVQ